MGAERLPQAKDVAPDGGIACCRRCQAEFNSSPDSPDHRECPLGGQETIAVGEIGAERGD